MSSMRLLDEGQTIRGTYEVERFLSEGAFGEVYRVKHRFLGRQALKVIKAAGMTHDEIERMLGEAILLSRLGHPNIIRVFDADTLETAKGVYGFFTMEYVAGGSLDQFWKSHGQQLIPVQTVVEIARQISLGLSVAHEEQPPIIHRDIKPQNILVGYDANGIRVRVTDFGLAKRANPLTLQLSARGTLPFKGPETFTKSDSDSCAGDIWSIGTTLYLLLTDRLPFPEMGNEDLPDPARFDRPMIPASRLNIQVDGALDQILFKALALAPQDRYQTAAELLKDLNKWKPRDANSKLQSKSAGSSENYKSALGPLSSVDEEKAEQMSKDAIELSRQAGKLVEAADLMEEAFNKWPSLRDKHEYQVKLWRRGLVG